MISSLVMDTQVEKSSVLERLPPVHVDGTIHFRATDYFAIDTSATATVSIASMKDEFVKEFLSDIEMGVPPGDIRVFRLKKTAHDSSILGALGRVHTVNLSDIWELLKQQPRGEKGALLTDDGKTNMFYCVSTNQKLFVVRARWRSGNQGWHLDTFSTNDPLSWGSGRRIFSR